jgi:P27 family predicted phage terminase small subunit
MASPGRIPMSTADMALRGGWRAKNRAQDGAVKPKAPSMPAWLPAAARKVWRQTVAAIRAARLLCPADAGVLASYCLALVEVEECTARLAVEGLMVECRGQRYPHPLVKVRAQAQQRVRALGSEMGLTPLSRKRAHVEAHPAAERDIDKVSSFARRRVPSRDRSVISRVLDDLGDGGRHGEGTTPA